MGLKMSEILLIMGALLLLFGSTRLPALGSSLGSAIRNFKKGFGGESEEANQPANGGSQAANGKLAQGGSGTAAESDKVASKQG